MKKSNFYILNKYYKPHKGGVETTVEEHAIWLSNNLKSEVNVLVANETPFKTTKYRKLKKPHYNKNKSNWYSSFNTISIFYPFYYFKYLFQHNVIFFMSH